MNKVILVGRLTKNPELKKLNEITVTNFTIAVNRNFKNKDGQYDADFINCIAFHGTGEFINKYFLKGQMIAVSGRIQTRNYDDKDGNKRFVSEVVVDGAEFAGDSKKEATETSNSDNSVLNEVPQNYKTEYSNEGIHLNDDDLPF